MDLVKGTKLGNYELVMRIGRGGMATVWVALEHTGIPEQDRLVAVKAMLADLADEPEFVRMFLDEVRLIRAIRHPNIVDVYDVGEEDDVMWMAMEWVEGESLHSVIAEAGKRRAIPSEIAVRIIADAAGGLHAAHELRDFNGVPQNLVHRDISPHNILISTSGQVKLVDFGVAKAVGRMSGNTRSGQLKGKFGYMSPEQVAGLEVDRRSDVFALGVVLYELTTSRRLFRGASDLETLRLVTSGQIPRPSRIDAGYPPGLERIVLQALERNPDRRYPTAAEFEGELRAFLRAERIVVPQSGVAGLLKRVMAARIEQRRRAVRKALKALEKPESVRTPQLISHEPAFTQSEADERDELSEVSRSSSVSNVSSLSQVGPRPQATSPSDLAPRSSGAVRILLVALLMTSAILGYVVYETRLKGALFRNDTPSPSPTMVSSESVTPTHASPTPAPSRQRSHAASGRAEHPVPDSSSVPRLSLDDLEVEAQSRETEPGP